MRYMHYYLSICILFVFYSFLASADSSVESKDSKKTSEVEILQSFSTAKGRLDIVTAQYNLGEFQFNDGKQLLLNDKPIGKVIESNLGDIKLLPLKKAYYIFIQLLAGGSGCPANYLLVDLTKNKDNIIDIFGNCSDIAAIKLKDNNQLLMEIGNEFWIYDGKAVSKLNPTEHDKQVEALRKKYLKK